MKYFHFPFFFAELEYKHYLYTGIRGAWEKRKLHPSIRFFFLNQYNTNRFIKKGIFKKISHLQTVSPEYIHGLPLFQYFSTKNKIKKNDMSLLLQKHSEERLGFGKRKDGILQRKMQTGVEGSLRVQVAKGTKTTS